MGYVYILTNPSFEEWVKIGMTEENDVQKRIDTLNSSSAVPFSFHKYATIETDQPKKLEGHIHALLDAINPDIRAREITDKGTAREREFFHIPAETAYVIFQEVVALSGIQTKLVKYKASNEELKEEAEADSLQEYHSKTTFKMLKIPVGTTLVYTEKESETCLTKDEDNTVIYKGEEYTLSGLVKNVLKPECNYAINGFRCFKIQGDNKTLRDKRLEMNARGES